MTSEVSANKLSPATGTTLTLGASGDTIAVGSGASTSGFDSGLASVQTFTSSGTWTRPSGITKVIMEVQGAGGGAARRDAAISYSQVTGAAGGYCQKLLDVSSISTSTITIGAAGDGTHASAPLNGGDGGTSSWADGTNTITAGGGEGGLYDSSSTGTSGGSATGGDVNIPGGNGFSGPLYYNVVAPSSRFGSGGNGIYLTQAYDAQAVGYGAGGGMLVNSTLSGDGGPGLIVVWEYK